ncbi:hypothetical protein Ahy_B06g086138 [Arachis hypogaea]|uniref:Uncharacterized protein n=1 Tax=Arachis hypogaea TaxID=3818 RepID=A0A444YWX6_ARAHY|nr:hypothetical protein Ahy_B06g086138 [Arachis hypogaea]
MGLRFYMRGKLLNVHIPYLANLVEKVRQTELMKKEKEKYRSEQRSKSKPFTRKEKVAYVTMESSDEEVDFETEVDLAELKKCPPYVCSLLKKLSSSEKSNDSKLKSGKKYSFDISKSYRIFDVRSQAIGVQWIRNCQEIQRRDHLYRRNPQWGHRAPSRNQYPYYRGRARGYPKGRGGRRNFNQSKKPQSEIGKEVSKGATPSVHSRIVFPSDGETYPRKFHHLQRWKKARQ